LFDLFTSFNLILFDGSLDFKCLIFSAFQNSGTNEKLNQMNTLNKFNNQCLIRLVAILTRAVTK